MIWMFTATAGALLDPAGEAQLMAQFERQLRTTESLSEAAALSLNAVPLEPAACGTSGDLDALRAIHFGETWQQQREPLERSAEALREALTMPTLVPLRSESRSAEQQSLLARDARNAAALNGFMRALERARRHQTRCPASLERTSGHVRPGIRAADDPPPLTAVWILEPGWMCGAESTAIEPGPLLLRSDRCWARDASCTCASEPVLPGAVL